MAKRVAGGVLMVLAIFGIAQARAASNPEPLLELPLEILLVRDMDLSRRGVDMTNWVAGAEIEQTVLPEINRIWRQAGITWKLTTVAEAVIGESEAKQDLKSQILKFEREPTQVSPQLSRTGRAIARQLGLSEGRFNLLVLPYLGRTLQGFAMPGARLAFLAAWTDKPSRGADAPRRVKLTEPEPLFVGSLGRTASHELGHLLGLKHDACATRCLMGGTRSQGYVLTAAEIGTARANAVKFLAAP